MVQTLNNSKLTWLRFNETHYPADLSNIFNFSEVLCECGALRCFSSMCQVLREAGNIAKNCIKL